MCVCVCVCVCITKAKWSKRWKQSSVFKQFLVIYGEEES